jgi:hypothetical protein
MTGMRTLPVHRLTRVTTLPEHLRAEP